MASKKTNINTKFAEKAEALKPELHERIVHPLSVIEFVPDQTAFFKCKAIETHTIQDLPSLSFGKDDQIILDFGSHHVGYLSFHVGVDAVDVDAPTRLRLTFGEIPYDVTEDLHPSKAGISTSWLPDEIINVDWLPTDVKMPRRYAFRYLKIEVLDTSQRYKVRFQNVKVRAVSAILPAVKVEALITTDKKLNELDRISQATLRDCAQTVFEDGPRRDRRLWLGDLRLQALTNYCTFKDFRLAKRCLYLFAALPREDESLPACLFEKPKLSAASDYIVDYDALFGPTVYDYALASGDLETARELWTTVLGSMKMPMSHLDKNGKFDSRATEAWKFLDWSEGLDTNAGMHGLVLYCCKKVNKLAKLIGEEPPYLDIVERMTGATSSFYNKTLRVFVSGPERQVSWISQAWMALSGAVDSHISLEAIRTAMKDSKALKPLTPYAYHHVAEALARCGGEADCLKLMRDYWGGMARAGADTFWECFDAEDSRRSPYGDCHNNSYCHAWSCTPSYLLRVVLNEYFKVEAHNWTRLTDQK
ncbi:alpha-L-rhamnosidase [Mollisia scopiformis]|uniref:Alpha-L-rhamnosidase n=1 Tax=Mollisia scopiformis TaxID=149040 RepID=A0A132BAN3_MOLSC|nr:alpha-L-rhamnosidase [Mollisia scopiformis]KUJ09475.1 alpha-L-rhamnosidase [Mollisia scopiformis]